MNQVRYLFWILPQLSLIFSGCSLLVGNYDPSTVQDGNEQSDASWDGGAEQSEESFDGGERPSLEDDGSQNQCDQDLSPPIFKNTVKDFPDLSADIFMQPIAFDTDVKSHCKGSFVENTPYGDDPRSFDLDLNPNEYKEVHTFTVPGMYAGETSYFYVRCMDECGHKNTSDLKFTFTNKSFTSTPIYRSVGVDQTGPVDEAGTTNPPAKLTLALSAALFDKDLTDNVGVGDILVYRAEDPGAIDNLAMITAQGDSRTFQVRQTDGKPPTSVTSTSNWAIFRAYTSLNDAIEGNENIGIPDSIRDFEKWVSGSPPNLSDLHATWNIACYAGALDNTNTVISGWTTDASHYLRVFTPYLETQVKTSQRHKGVWGDPKLAYTIQTASNGAAITSSIKYAKFEGLQINVPKGSSSDVFKGIHITNAINEAPEISISNCIFHGWPTDGVESCGVKLSDTNDTTGTTILYLWNNIIYGFNITTATDTVGGVLVNSGRLEAYNNTIAKNRTGIFVSSSGQALAINNLFFSHTNHGASGTFLSGTGYNATETDMIGYTPIPGNNDKTQRTFSFSDEPYNNYHLIYNDSGARDNGKDLSGSFTDDIDGQQRPYNGSWDIGADEYFP